MIDESIKEQVENILERERWAARVSGKVDGALNVLFLLDISKEERISLLSRALGLSTATATDFVEDRTKDDLSEC